MNKFPESLKNIDEFENTLKDFAFILSGGTLT